FVYLSDAVYVKGKVTKKYFDDNGEACVDVDTCAINQRGEDTMPGNSTLVLPSRDKGTWPAQKRMS
ncbi:MAG: acyl dehydratase, partial [Dehalococcoidia bacterium]